MSHKICENCCVYVWNKEYFNNYYLKNCQKILFPVFIGKIIYSLPYAVAQLIFYDVALTISMSHADVWKYESQHRNSIQVSVP